MNKEEAIYQTIPVRIFKPPPSEREDIFARSCLPVRPPDCPSFCPLQNNSRYVMKLGGWSSGATVLGKLLVPVRPAGLDKSRARAY